MKRLIVNADGFGFTFGINKGIFESVTDGIVTSTSCVVNFPAIEDVGKLAREFKPLSIGIHFNLSVGSPVCKPKEIPSLVDETGEFHGARFSSLLMKGKIVEEEMVKELRAQARILKSNGVEISHWDGHQNKHLYPPFFRSGMSIAKEFGIKAIRTHRRYLFSSESKNRTRVLVKYYISHPKQIATHIYARRNTRMAERNGFKAADRLITPAYLDRSKKSNLETWISIMKRLPEGTNEIYCHPGYPDDTLRKYAVYVDERLEEVAIMKSAEVKEAARENGVTLISFWEL